MLRRILASGALSALLMNACLFLAPFAGAALAHTLDDPAVFGFPSTPAARAETRNAVEEIAARLAPQGLSRRRGWEELVARELREGDPHAARGFVLSARTMLGGGAASRINRTLDADPSDAEIAAAAAELLSNETRGVFQDAAAWMAQADAAPDSAAFIGYGGLGDLQRQAQNWIAGRDDDHLALSLMALHVAFSDAISPNAARGAAALRDARRAGRLHRRFAAALEARARIVFPDGPLRGAVAAAAAQSDGGRGVARAFHTHADMRALDAFAALLEDIGAMTAATSSRGAGRLLAQARSNADLPRLRLVAQAGGDRATAVAKRLTDSRALVHAAHGTTTWTSALTANVVTLISIAVGMTAAAATVFANAIVRFFRYRPTRRRRIRQAAAKAAAQKPARAGDPETSG
ncbi:MAG: hypothetical protein GC206_12175 [Alphaproteobacteria bacterium]|nr:hypothetical protein [Alphaproteobacteria bacterium]